MTTRQLRSVGTNAPDWVHRTITIGADNLDQFVLLTNRRDLRNSHVNSIKRTLEKGGHFQAPFVVNEVNGKYRLIDGNHRLEAIERFVKAHPGRKVKVHLNVYDKLSIAKEREEYTVWNSGVKQSVNDFVKLHWDSLKLPSWWRKNANDICRLSHKWGVETIELKVLLGAYFQQSKRELSYRGKGEVFINEVKALTLTDYEALKDYMTHFVKEFGKPRKEDTAYRQLQFGALSSVYWRNTDKGTPKELVQRLRKALNDPRFVNPPLGVKSGSGENLKWLYDIVVENANKGYGRNVSKEFLTYTAWCAANDKTDSSEKEAVPA